jgi:hypothetical protein
MTLSKTTDYSIREIVNCSASKKIIIVGGGIVGLLIALKILEQSKDANVTLYEKEATLCAGASGNSHRTIHCGLREFSRGKFLSVLDQIRSAQFWLNSFPDLVRPLPCLMPINGLAVKRYFYQFGATLFDLATGAPAGKTTIISRQEALELAPCLEKLVFKNALKWHDATVLDPTEITQLLCTKITALGGKIYLNSAVQGLDPAGTVTLTNNQSISADLIFETTGGYASPSHIAVPRLWGYNLVLDCNLSSQVAFAFSTPDLNDHSSAAHRPRSCSTESHSTESRGTGSQINESQINENQSRMFFVTPRFGATTTSALGTGYSTTPNNHQSYSDTLARVTSTLGVSAKIIGIEEAELAAENNDCNSPKAGFKILKRQKLIKVVAAKYTHAPVVANKAIKYLEY